MLHYRSAKRIQAGSEPAPGDDEYLVVFNWHHVQAKGPDALASKSSMMFSAHQVVEELTKPCVTASSGSGKAQLSSAAATAVKPVVTLGGMCSLTDLRCGSVMLASLSDDACLNAEITHSPEGGSLKRFQLSDSEEQDGAGSSSEYPQASHPDDHAGIDDDDNLDGSSAAVNSSSDSDEAKLSGDEHFATTGRAANNSSSEAVLRMPSSGQQPALQSIGGGCGRRGGSKRKLGDKKVSQQSSVRFDRIPDGDSGLQVIENTALVAQSSKYRRSADRDVDGHPAKLRNKLSGRGSGSARVLPILDNDGPGDASKPGRRDSMGNQWGKGGGDGASSHGSKSTSQGYYKAVLQDQKRSESSLVLLRWLILIAATVVVVLSEYTMAMFVSSVEEGELNAKSISLLGDIQFTQRGVIHWTELLTANTAGATSRLTFAGNIGMLTDSTTQLQALHNAMMAGFTSESSELVRCCSLWPQSAMLRPAVFADNSCNGIHSNHPLLSRRRRCWRQSSST